MAKKKKDKTVYYDPRSVKDKLTLINLYKNEDFLYPILVELFKSQDYKDVRVNHGTDEYGKDIVFKTDSPHFSVWYACVVKNKGLKMRDIVNGGDIYQQINMAFNIKYSDCVYSDIKIDKVFVITDGTYSRKDCDKPLESLPQKNNIILWNSTKLQNEIEKHIKITTMVLETTKNN